MAVASTVTGEKKGRKGLVAIVLILFILLAGLATGLFLINRPEPQVIQNKAAEPVCPVNGATCSWTASPDAQSYDYTITDQTTSQVVAQGNTANTQVSFTSQVDHTYVCEVKPVNSCGPGTPASATNTCTAHPTATPTPTTSVTPTETPTPTPTTTVTPSETETPTPTGEVTPTEIEVAQTSPTETPAAAPTTPVAGNSSGVYFMVICGIILVTLMLVF